MPTFPFFQPKKTKAAKKSPPFLSFFLKFVYSIQRATATAIITKRIQAVLTGVIQIHAIVRCLRCGVGSTAEGYTRKTPVQAVTVRSRIRTAPVATATGIPLLIPKTTAATAAGVSCLVPSTTTAAGASCLVPSTAVATTSVVTAAAVALIYPDIAVTIAADRLSTPVPSTASSKAAGITTAARASVIVARITKIAHNRISIPLVYLR